MRPRNRISWSHWDREIGHKHFCPILWSQWDHGIESCCLNETAETNWDRGINDKNFQFYLRIFGCSLLEPHNFHVGSRGLNETAESVPAVSMRPRNRIPQSQWDRRIQHENFCPVSMRPRDRFLRSQWDRKFYDTEGILTKTNIGSHSV
jgi:hypothetical protein